jgi:hypothetical protein
MATAGLDRDREALTQQQDALRRRLVKIRELVRVEAISIDDWQREKADLEDQLGRIVLPAEHDMDAAAEHLEIITRVWSHPSTTPEQRYELAHGFFGRVAVDLDRGAITEASLPGNLALLVAAPDLQSGYAGVTEGFRLRWHTAA